MATAFFFNHCLAENIEQCCQELIPYLASQLKRPITFDLSLSPAQRLVHLGADKDAFAWLCGLQFISLKKEGHPLQALAAPIMNGNHQAYYHSTIIVHKDSSVKSLLELEQAAMTFVVNEFASFSGYHSVRHHFHDTLSHLEHIITGSHRASLDYISQEISKEKAAFAAIDSTLFAYWQRSQAEILNPVRVLARLNNFPIPPLVTHSAMPQASRQSLLAVLLSLADHPDGQILLERHGISSFIPVEDADYHVFSHIASHY